LTGAVFDLLYTSNATAYAKSPWSVGFFYNPAGDGPREIHITGVNAGIQSAMYIYPDNELVVVVLSNSWGIGARSGEMVADLPERLAALCLGNG
jgi:CubicO group peptidase (beta-lactamase class C family)